MPEDERACDDQSCTEESCEGCAHANPDGTCGGSAVPQIQPQNAASDVRRVIGVVSGKGGVGKSLVTAMLASGMKTRGHDVAIMDADITGPSIPRIYGVTRRMGATADGLIPGKTPDGMGVVSINLLLPEETDPVIWRGPIIGNVVTQFWTDVAWGNVDYMFVDMPPGTGDVALTVFQSLPIDGIIIVATPQELVGMIVTKAIKMAREMNVPVLGLVENMSYLTCPDCGKRINVFGESHLDQIAEESGIKATAQLPMDPAFAKACDEGEASNIPSDELAPIFTMLEKMD